MNRKTLKDEKGSARPGGEGRLVPSEERACARVLCVYVVVGARKARIKD